VGSNPTLSARPFIISMLQLILATEYLM
jgi:hypothetical protein